MEHSDAILLHGLGVPVALRLMLPANLLLRILQLHLPTGMKIRRSTVDDKLLFNGRSNPGSWRTSLHVQGCHERCQE